MKSVAPILFAFAPALLSAGEMDIAREALRDGLWEVARTHAARLEGDEAKLLILETYARERDWRALVQCLDLWGGITGEGFAYYRALALAELGDGEAAANQIAAAEFSDPVYVALGAVLRARLAVKAGNAQEAADILRKVDLAGAEGETKLAAADVLAVAGERPAAEKLWREIVAATNLDERVTTAAAVNLGEIALIESAYARAKSTVTRRKAGLALALKLVESKASLERGAGLIRAIVKDSPDADGAKDAYLALAEAYLDADEYNLAAEAYRVALETWPETARMAKVQEGRGWALRKLGRNEEAIEAFSRAEESATNDSDRADAILRQGDALADCGRGEEAMAKYREVLERYPETPSGEKLKVMMHLRDLETRGRDLYREYKFEEAIAVFEELARSSQEYRSRAEYFQMLCLYGLGKDEAALAKARALADGDSDARVRAEATLWIAKYEYNRRNWKTSCAYFAAFASMRPDSSEAPSALAWSARAAFADNDFALAIQTAANLAERYPDSQEKAAGFVVQGESLIELARFDEAVLVLDRAIATAGAPAAERARAQMLKADALFAMGADNPRRYREALDAYRAIRLGESLSPAAKLSVSFKIGLTLEKLKRLDEAQDEYYTQVVLAYRQGRLQGVRYDDDARAAFARAAFRLVDEYESRGQENRAMRILELVIASGVPAAKEAEKRLDRIQMRGKFL